MEASKKIRDLIECLGAEIACGETFQEELVSHGFASDLMSDVLTLDCEDIVLITGLANVQTIRTAEMADIKCIIFVRDKEITQAMRVLAEENEMILIRCKYSMFKTNGLLYQCGLNPIY